MFFLLIWSIYFILCEYEKNITESSNQGIILAIVDYVIQIVTIFMTSMQYLMVRRCGTREDKFNFLSLLSIYIWLLIVDLFFYIAAYASNSHYLQNLSYLNFIFYYVPCIIYALMMFTFLSKIIIKNIIKSKRYQPRVLLLLLISLGILFIYLTSIHYAYPVLSFVNALQMILLFTEFLLFDIAIIGLIYANNLNAFLLLIGVISLVTGDFFLTYTYISQTITKYFITGEFFWCLGILFLFFTALNINKTHDFSISSWFRSDRAIKSRVGFHVYNISLAGYLIIYFICYCFRLISKDFIILFPALTMLYSILVVLLSIFISKKFEEPFQELQNNIQNFLSGLTFPESDFYFDIQEFSFLQNFLMKAVEIKEHNDKLYIQLGKISTQIAHDIGSPLSTIEYVMENFKNNIFLPEHVELLDESAKSLNGISSRLLGRYGDSKNQNYNIDDQSVPRFFMLFKLIQNLIKIKEIEWRNENYIIKYTFDKESSIRWHYASLTQIKAKLSNILNNARESLDESGIINVDLSVIDNNFLLIIQDNGIGIPENKIYAVLNGESSKHSGKGIGLSSANEYFKTINGQLRLESKLNQGTKITINIPVANQPEWHPSSIKYNAKSIFIVLDDAPSMHMLWQQKLGAKRVKLKLFINVTDFIEWRKSQVDTESFIYIVDYDLGDKVYNGFKVINELDIQKQSYLVTSHAEEAWLQDLCVANKIFLIPKNQIANYLLELI